MAETFRPVFDPNWDQWAVRQYIGTATHVDLARFATKYEADAFILGLTDRRESVDVGRTWDDKQHLNEAYDRGRDFADGERK